MNQSITKNLWPVILLMITAAIFTLAVTGRHVVNFLKDSGLLAPTLVAAFGCTLAVFIFAARWEMVRLDKKRAALAAALFFLAAITASMATRTWGETIHVVEYELLAFAAFMWLRDKLDGPRLYSSVMALVLVVGWSDEIVQYFVPDRYYDITDVLLNLVSGAVGLAIAIVLTGGGRGRPE